MAEEWGSVQSTACVLTAGAAGEAVVVVQVPHCLAGLVGSVDLLVALNAGSWNNKGHLERLKELQHCLYDSDQSLRNRLTMSLNISRLRRALLNITEYVR